MKEISKWVQTIKTSLSKHMAYRFNFFLQIIAPALVLFFIQYNLWKSIFGGDTTSIINGYTFNEMIKYHVWSTVVVLIGQGHMAYNMSEDIRMGRISAHLIYPFEFWKFHTASFISFQFIQLIVAITTIALMVFFNVIPVPSLGLLFAGFSYTVITSFFWFSLQYLTGIMAFWLEETWILRVMAQILTRFLSGALLPLEFFPSWARDILVYSPFPYLSFYPIKTFTGDYDPFPQGFIIIAIWIAIVAFLNHLLWKRGIKLYTAAGM